MLQQSHEDPTGASEEPERWRHIDQNVDHCEAGEEKADLLKETELNEEDVEDPQQVLEEISLEDNTREQLTPGRPEHFGQLQMTDGPTQEKEQRSEEEEQPQNLKQSQEDVDLAEGAVRPENADLPDKRAADETVEAEQQPEQTEPSEQKEPTSRSAQATLPEQLVQPRETDEPEITEQLPAESEATEQTAEGEFARDTQATTSPQLRGEELGVREAAEAAVADGEQVNAAEPAAPHLNGCEVDSEMARRLAERLFQLDGFQRVDVVKHLDKE